MFIFKKVLISLMALITALGCFGCNLYEIDDEKVGKDMEEILTEMFSAIKNDNKERFKTFFADHVVGISDFENGFDYVCELYEGNLVDINARLPFGTGDKLAPDLHLEYAFTAFDIITSNNEYIAYVEFYTKAPNNQYKIRKFKLLEKQAFDSGEESFSDCGMRYGIYYPGWIDEEII